jgi:hypothetical protein
MRNKVHTDPACRVTEPAAGAPRLGMIACAGSTFAGVISLVQNQLGGTNAMSMKRKANYKAWFWSNYRRGAVSPELLQTIGHLSFLWNDVEEALDRALVGGLEIAVDLQVDVRSRIQGLDGKIEIVKAVVNASELIDDAARKSVLETLGALQGFKERRDAVIHAKGSEIHNGVARTFERRGSVYEVLLTTEALNNLNLHMEVFAVEMAALAGFVGMSSRTGLVFRRSLENAKDGSDKAMMRQMAVADRTALQKMKACQKERRELPPMVRLKAEGEQ